MTNRLAWLLALLLPFALSRTAVAQFDAANPLLTPPAPLNERVLRLPGDPGRPVTLEVTLYQPSGPGPFPLAVMNHGATHVGAGNRGERYRYTFSAFYFLSRGYAVALPMARGFAGSGGRLVADGCSVDTVGLLNAQDVRAVIGALRGDKTIDATRIVVGGQSFGGWTTIALGTLDIPGMRGLIGFSPAIRSSDCGWQDQAMIAAARRFGFAARYPSIWFYGDNDSVMPAATWHGVFSAYSTAARRAELVSVGTFMEDSHQLLSFPEGLPIWTPKVDAFLAKIGLPSEEKYPAYLPTPTPPASNFAALGDVAAVPWLNDKGRTAYRQFLTRHFPRVFLLAPSGGFAIMDGGFDPLARGLALCGKSGLACQPYAIDARVVWTGGPQTPKIYARMVPAGQTTTLDFSWSVDRNCLSRGLPKLWVTEAPHHGTASVTPRDGHPGFPPGHPLASCDAATVPGVAVTYTPAAGYSGDDTVAFEETDVDGGHRSFRAALTVR